MTYLRFFGLPPSFPFARTARRLAGEETLPPRLPSKTAAGFLRGITFLQSVCIPFHLLILSRAVFRASGLERASRRVDGTVPMLLTVHPTGHGVALRSAYVARVIFFTNTAKRVRSISIRFLHSCSPSKHNAPPLIMRYFTKPLRLCQAGGA